MTYLLDTNVISEICADHIIAVDAAVAEQWGRLNVPDPLPVIGGLLAATARAHGLTLATRNAAGLATSGVALVNPWDGPRATGGRGR
jgi:predicted nucleic acid-binding protein